MKKSRIIFTFNAPAVLTFALASLAALLLGITTDGRTTAAFFSVYNSSFLNPLTYVRLLGHVLGHTSFAHYVSNMALILALGPIVEERYGSLRLLLMIAVTAVVSGLFHIFLGSGMLMGASGVVYMLIFLASTSGAKSGEIPLTLVAVAALYLTQEIMDGLFAMDNISQLSHIVGGVCGAIMGLLWHR